MEAFVVKILSSLLIIALMTSSVEAKRSHKENKNGGRTLVRGTKNSSKEDDNQDVTGTRKDIGNPPNVFNLPNQQCYTQFFVEGHPPQGLRAGINLQRMKYICQRGNQQGNQQTYYGTMFDERLGIPLFSAYTLSPVDVRFPSLNAQQWRKTPGIERQGSNVIYPPIPYDRGHLVPRKTYSSTEQRHSSTYTFTNAVPQRPAFNRGKWFQFERMIRLYAESKCKPLNGVLYLLTGSSFAHIVPLPQHGQNVHVDAKAAITNLQILPAAQDQPAIAIPNSMWTAGCCVWQQNGNQAESFAVIGNNVNNVQEGLLTLEITVANLQNILLKDVGGHGYGWGGEEVNLFPGNENCHQLVNNPVNNNHGELPLARARERERQKQRQRQKRLERLIKKKKRKFREKAKARAQALITYQQIFDH